MNGSVTGADPAPITALPEDPLERPVKVIDDAGAAVLGRAVKVLDEQALQSAGRLTGGDPETDAATLDGLIAILNKRSQAVREREELHLALAEILSEVRPALPPDAKQIVAGIVLQTILRPDAVAVAWVATFAEDVWKEIEGLVALLEDGVSWLATVALVEAGVPVTGQSYDELLEATQKYPEVLGWAQGPLLNIKHARDVLNNAREFVGNFVDDPLKTLLDGGELVVGAFRLIAIEMRESHADIVSDLREASHEPLAVGEVLGHISAFIFLFAVGIVLSEVDIAALGTRAVEEIQLIKDVLEATGEGYKPKLLTFERLRRALAVYRESVKLRLTFSATGRLVGIIGKITEIDAALARDMAQIAEKVIAAQIKRLDRKVASYAELARINKSFHDRLLVGMALRLRSEGMVTLGADENALATWRVRHLWYEGAHIVDARFFEAYTNDFVAIGFPNSDELPAVNATSGQHTLSERRAVQRLFRSKGENVTVNSGDTTESITKIFNERIVRLGTRTDVKTARLVFDPKVTKPSEVLKVARQVWTEDVKTFKLPPEGFARLDEVIAKLVKIGR